jgi:hypothetical protein
LLIIILLNFTQSFHLCKLQWLQDPSEINGDDLNNIRPEASRHFRNKKKYLKDKINELGTKSKSKNLRDLYRGINEFKRGYQPRSNLMKDENGDLLAGSHNILNRWKNYFSVIYSFIHLFTFHGSLHG